MQSDIGLFVVGPCKEHIEMYVSQGRSSLSVLRIQVLVRTFLFDGSHCLLIRRALVRAETTVSAYSPQAWAQTPPSWPLTSGECLGCRAHVKKIQPRNC